MSLSKERAREIQRGDFIPGGQPVKISELSFRRTSDSEVYRCCAQTGSDPQSGPIYCGKVAEFVAFLENERGSYVGLCGERKHIPPKQA